jgi:hypothetical protein
MVRQKLLDERKLQNIKEKEFVKKVHDNEKKLKNLKQQQNEYVKKKMKDNQHVEEIRLMHDLSQHEEEKLIDIKISKY